MTCISGYVNLVWPAGPPGSFSSVFVLAFSRISTGFFFARPIDLLSAKKWSMWFWARPIACSRVTIQFLTEINLLAATIWGMLEIVQRPGVAVRWKRLAMFCRWVFLLYRWNAFQPVDSSSDCGDLEFKSVRGGSQSFDFFRRGLQVLGQGTGMLIGFSCVVILRSVVRFKCLSLCCTTSWSRLAIFGRDSNF